MILSQRAMACPVLAQHESWRQHESRLAMTKTYTQVLLAILLVWFHVRLCGAFCGCSDLQPLALPFTTGLRHGFHLCLLILGTFPMQILPRHMPHPGHQRTVLGRHGSWRGGYVLPNRPNVLGRGPCSPIQRNPMFDIVVRGNHVF